MQASPFTFTVVGFDGALASAITGALDLFSFTGITWERFNGLPVKPKFRTQVATLHGADFVCTNKIEMKANIAIEDVSSTDILLVPTIGANVNDVVERSFPLIHHLQRLFSTGCDVVSNCSGAFLLAEAGLLNNRRATTHWGYAESFKTRYPDVALDTKALITQDNNLYCAGGGLAFHDISLLLIERYCGRDVANQVAKAHVINRIIGSQHTYANLHSFKAHRIESLSAVQNHIESNFKGSLEIKKLADIGGVTPRTLHRLFNKFVGLSPRQYIQIVRIENAKRILEQQSISTQRLPEQVGYGDNASFTRLFKKLTGITPVQYQKQFNRTLMH